MSSERKGLTWKELDEWAQIAFPTEFSRFKTRINQIMTPIEIPQGWTPQTVGGPMPDFRDWVVPLKADREKLVFQKHMCLVIGFFNTDGKSRKKADKLCVFLTWPDGHMQFCRYSQGELKAYHVEHGFDNADLTLFPLFRALHTHDRHPQKAVLIRTTALYLHMLRMLADDFHGPFASQKNFEAACKAWYKYTSTRPHLLAPVQRKYPPFVPFVKAPTRLQPISAGADSSRASSQMACYETDAVAKASLPSQVTTKAVHQTALEDISEQSDDRRLLESLEKSEGESTSVDVHGNGNDERKKPDEGERYSISAPKGVSTRHVQSISDIGQEKSADRQRVPRMRLTPPTLPVTTDVSHFTSSDTTMADSGLLQAVTRPSHSSGARSKRKRLRDEDVDIGESAKRVKDEGTKKIESLEAAIEEYKTTVLHQARVIVEQGDEITRLRDIVRTFQDAIGKKIQTKDASTG